MATTIERALAVPAARMKFLARLHGSKDETPEGVPAKQQAAFWDDVTYHAQRRAKWVDEVCREFGSPDGTFEHVPVKDKANVHADLELHEGALRHDNCCTFELALLRIDDAEAEADKMDFG